MARLTRKSNLYSTTATKKITKNDCHRLQMEKRRTEKDYSLALLTNWRAA
jgi:hypothetical protein